MKMFAWRKRRKHYVVPEGKAGPLAEKGKEEEEPELEDDELQGVESVRQKVWSFVDDPSSSTGAQVFSVMVIMAITLSCVSFCLETIPELEVRYGLLWTRIEQICVGFFTVEYLIRLASCPSKVAFFKGWLNAVDLISIIPFYITFVQQQITSGQGTDSGKSVQGF